MADLTTPKDIDRLLREIGVEDIEDGHHYVAKHAPLPSTASGGLLVRAPRKGGSPVLNLITRAIAFLCLCLLFTVPIGLGWWWAQKRSKAKESHLDSGEIVVSCQPRWWHRRRGVTDLFNEAPAIAMSAVRLPQDQVTLAQLGVQSYDMQGDRVDIFPLAGGKLAVRYVAAGPTVRSVSVGFDAETSPCRALWLTGLLDEKGQFKIDRNGFFLVVDGRPGPFWAHGVVRARMTENGNVAALQLQAQP